MADLAWLALLGTAVPGSVAVTEIRTPFSVAGSVVTSKEASPDPSVVTGLVPR